MEKTFRYRIYPNKKQKELIKKTFGCTRFVYNYFLSKRKEIYESESRNMRFPECSRELTKLKQQLEWLKEPDKCALQNTLKDLDKAYCNFFEHQEYGYPKFKSKKVHRKSYRTNSCLGSMNKTPTIEFVEMRIKLPKIGWVKTRDKRNPEGRILNAIITQEPSGKFFVSLCCTDIEEKPLHSTNEQIGLDLGLKNYCITSNGDKYHNPAYFQKSLNKLARLQRELSRKSSFGSNHERARIKVARQYEKISNQRKDYLQKLSTKLIRENDLIAIEDLKVTSLLQNSSIARDISDASWYSFKRQLEYKARWYGRQLYKVNTFYPSSQICHVCGHRYRTAKDLHIREWNCPKCGEFNDRDVNAAINILNAVI